MTKLWFLYQTDETGDWEILKTAWTKSEIKAYFIEVAREILADEPEEDGWDPTHKTDDEIELDICRLHRGQPYYTGLGWCGVDLPPVPQATFEVKRELLVNLRDLLLSYGETVRKLDEEGRAVEWWANGENGDYYITDDHYDELVRLLDDE